MPRPIRSIEIYLPLDYNDGQPIPTAKFISVQQQLLAKYGGVTSTHKQSPLQGLWESEGEVYQDRVVVFTVMDFGGETPIQVLQFLEKLKARLKRKFDQLEVLITVLELLAV